LTLSGLDEQFIARLEIPQLDLAAPLEAREGFPGKLEAGRKKEEK